ncbi:MAG: hypothetical protein ABI623_07325 [bacterium]
MKFFKYLALLALASVPLMLIEKQEARRPRPSTPDDDIFEHDLRAD